MPAKRRAFRLNWYNGFSPEERLEKHWAVLDAIDAGRVAKPEGPCALCQASGPVVYHSEDYGSPYVFTPPAMYAICRSGHSLIHLRFRFPSSWEAFKQHLLQGGTCSGWATRRGPRQQLSASDGAPPVVHPGLTADDWWEHLTLDRASLTARWARPLRCAVSAEQIDSHLSDVRALVVP